MELGMVVFLHPASRVLVAVSIIALQLLRESYLELSLATVMCVIPLHAANGLLANDVTEFGMSMMVKPVQLSNAHSPMVVTELGIVMLVNPLQYMNALLPIVVTELGIVISVNPIQP